MTVFEIRSAVRVNTPEWRQIPSFPDYEASDEGQVRRIGRKRFQIPHAVRGGYLRVNLYAHARARVNRLVCEAFRGPAPSDKHEAAHNDGNRSNNRPGNLRWATRLENMADAQAHGTIARGEKQGASRLSADQVRQIRTLEGIPQRELAARFGVCQRTICVILTRQGWLHV